MNTLRKISFWVLVIAIFYGVSAANDGMQPDPSTGFHPVMIIVVAALVTVLFPRFVEIARKISIFVLALIIYKLAALMLDVDGAEAPSGTLIAFGVVAIIWMLSSSGLAPAFNKLWDYIYSKVS